MKPCPFCGKTDTFEYRYDTRIILADDTYTIDIERKDGDNFVIECRCGCRLSCHMDELNDELGEYIKDMNDAEKDNIVENGEEYLWKMLEKNWDERNGN